MVIKRSRSGEFAGAGRWTSKSTSVVPAWTLTAFGDSSMSKLSHRDLALVWIDLATSYTDSGKLSSKCEYPPQKWRYRSFPWPHENKNGAMALLITQTFQRGFICRNRPRDDEARFKSFKEEPSVRARGPWVPAGGVNCSLYAAMELSSSFFVLGNLFRLVPNESSCFPWSFSPPSSEE